MQAEAGKSVVLPCMAVPQQALRMVDWKKGIESVCLYRQKDPKPECNETASLFNETSGNCSMKLSAVKHSDSGAYTCSASFSKDGIERNVKRCSVTLLGK